MSETLKPGIHHDIPHHDYLRIPALSASLAQSINATSLWHAAHAVEKSSDAMDVGTAAHLASTTPHLFDEEYQTAGQCCATKKPKKGETEGALCTNTGVKTDGEGHWYCGVRGHAPKGAKEPTNATLSPENRARVLDMAEAVNAHPQAGELLSRCTRYEVTAILERPGGLIKCRPDGMGDNLIVELKFLRDASPRGFAKAIADRGYHMAAYSYRMILSEILDWTAVEYYWIVCENERPIGPQGVAVYRPSVELLMDGEEEYERAYDQWSMARKLGEWPGYAEGVHEIDLPRWKRKALEAEDVEF